eukprot:358068-Ditylum_brightwellii.AAC.1
MQSTIGGIVGGDIGEELGLVVVVVVVVIKVDVEVMVAVVVMLMRGAWGKGPNHHGRVADPIPAPAEQAENKA